MGELEKDLKRRIRMSKIQRSVLSTVAVAGMIAIGAVPVRALSSLLLKGDKRRHRSRVETSFGRLMKAGLIEVVDGYARLTRGGESYAKRLEIDDFKIKKPKRWDGKWRVIIFDIPERKKVLRNKMRDTFVRIGFVRLQDSVWVYPYDCEDLITFLKADFKVGKDLLYIIADKIENDKNLKISFGL
jgi:CRISPR-associated endonuclease Cas2